MTARLRFEVLLLTALLLVRVLVVPVIFLNFELRQDFVARYLCENRHRPERHCDGHCYLAKQLKATQEREQSEKNQQLGQYLFETPFVTTSTRFSFAAFSPTDAISAPPAYRVCIPTGSHTSPFRPPRG